MARGFRALASLRSFPQAPLEWCSEIAFQKIDEESGFPFRRAEFRPEGRFAALDEYVQAFRHDFHPWARLLRIRSKWKQVSRFSGWDRGERARVFLSGPGENDPARGGPRGSRLEPFSQPVSRAARGEAREVVGHGPRLFHQQRFRSRGGRAKTRAHRRKEKVRRRSEDALPGARTLLSRTHLRRAFDHASSEIP